MLGSSLCSQSLHGVVLRAEFCHKRIFAMFPSMLLKDMPHSAPPRGEMGHFGTSPEIFEPYLRAVPNS
jgi:hypothetical protein